MNTPELKNILISKISQIDDAEFLLALKIILDSKNSTLTHNDYEEYNYEILKAEEDIANNKLYSHKNVEEKIEEWKKR
ncbi:MAG: hypothetical protein QE264_03855 [Flavobacterium sp.]|jgi:hypothetical protein|nr:hypothetical protein [Flavobacterium sp.]